MSFGSFTRDTNAFSGSGFRQQPSYDLTRGPSRTSPTSGSLRLSDLGRRLSPVWATDSLFHKDNVPFAFGQISRRGHNRGLNERYKRLERATTGRTSDGAPSYRQQRSNEQIQLPALEEQMCPDTIRKVRCPLPLVRCLCLSSTLLKSSF